MPKIMISFCLLLLHLISYSQVIDLLHPFVLSDDIDSIDEPLKLPQISVPEAGDILSWTNYSCLNSCEVLPVQILSFEAERKSDSVVKVTWKTTYEVSNQEFIVQRSLGNTAFFKDEGRVAADYLPAMTHHYTFLDGNDYENISYYRLQQIDINQEFTYSRIVAVKGNSRFESISVYPNPATTNVLVDVRLNKMDKVTIDIYNSQGQRINGQSGNYKKGSNLNDFKLTQYDKGIYFIRAIKSDGNILTTKFIKQ